MIPFFHFNINSYLCCIFLIQDYFFTKGAFTAGNAHQVNAGSSYFWFSLLHIELTGIACLAAFE
jgi:hypothetical protein